MQLEIITPSKQVYSGTATSVQLPGLNGSFEILNHHAPLIAALGSGVVRVITDGKEHQSYQITSGFIEVIDNEVAVLVESIVEE